MPRRSVQFAGLLVAASCALGAVSVAAGAATPEAFTSTIQSRSTTSCVDVPGGTKDINTDVVGRACVGSAEQSFRFKPVTNRPGTYRIVNQVSGLCMAPYRFGVRQASMCTYPAPNTTFPMWDLLPVNAAAHTFQLEPTSQEGSTMPRCVTAYVVGGTMDRDLVLDFCDNGNPAQVFTIPGL